MNKKYRLTLQCDTMEADEIQRTAQVLLKKSHLRYSTGQDHPEFEYSLVIMLFSII